MRVADLYVKRWRNLWETKIVPPRHARVVCLVGENGSGKSSILELLTATAFMLNLSQGAIQGRNPFGEPHEFSVTLDFSNDLRTMQFTAAIQKLVDSGAGFTHPLPIPIEDALAGWDGSLTLHSKRDVAVESHETRVEPGGQISPDISSAVAERLTAALYQIESAVCLSLDAARVAPSGVRTEDDDDAFSPRSWHDRATFEAHIERRSGWIGEFLARDQEAAREHWELHHEAAASGFVPPPFENPNIFFRDAVVELLPHVKFLRADSSLRDLLFEVNGQRVPLASLSSGEQEIIYLVGQLATLPLDRGLLLLDEPELRLNPALHQSWLRFLSRRVGGQVWLGTHSFEAVKAAGPASTFLLTRAGIGTGAGTYATRSLAEAPLLATVSASIGWPAYSLARRFLFVEGASDTRHDDLTRFLNLLPATTGDPVSISPEQGCPGVLKAFRGLVRMTADASVEEREQLRVGAVVDRDHRDQEEVSRLVEEGIHVLECHELENLYLHPPSIVSVLEGIAQEQVLDSIRRAADRRGGSWIVGRAHQRHRCSLDSASRRRLLGTAWTDCQTDPAGVIVAISELSDSLDDGVIDLLRALVHEYAELRQGPEFWSECEGKEVGKVVGKDLGIGRYQDLELLLSTLWADKPAEAPEALKSLRRYADRISPLQSREITPMWTEALGPAGHGVDEK